MKLEITLLLVVTVLVVVGWLAQSCTPTQQIQTDDKIIKNEIIIELDVKGSIEEVVKDFERLQMEVKKMINKRMKLYLVTIHYQESTTQDILQQIKGHAMVKEAQFNTIVEPRN